MKNYLTFPSSDQPENMVQINTTPLIDVMLVLLIMLIITIPIRHHAVNLDLPDTNNRSSIDANNLIRITIDEFGLIKIDNRVINNKDDLRIVLARISSKDKGQNILINSHSKSNYGDIASVLFEARKAGIREIGFVGIERF